MLWVAAPGRDPVPAWPVWRDGATYLLTGPGEQACRASPTRASARSPRARPTPAVASYLAGRVAGVERDSDEWRQVVPALTAGRLNGHPDWTTAVVLRLTPVA